MSSRSGPPMATGRRLFSPFAAWFPGGATISQPYLRLFPDPYTEPDKRISHTSGSSVNLSDCLQTTTRIQVFADNWCGPLNQLEYLLKPFPCIAGTMTFAINPFIQDSRRIVNVATTFVRIVRYGVIVQMACHTYLGPLQHLCLAQYIPAPARPVSELLQALSKLLAAGASFKSEVSSF